MNKFLSTLLLSSSLGFLCSCDPEDIAKTEEVKVDWKVPLTSEGLGKFSDEVKHCLPKKTVKCSAEKVVFEKAKAQKSSEGQRILLLSTEGEPVYMSSFLKYKDRVLDHYHPGEDNKLESFAPVVHYPKVLNDIFVENNYFRDRNLEELSEQESYVLYKLHNLYKKEDPKQESANFSHFSNFLLNDLNPDAQFVYVRIPELSPEDLSEHQDNMSAVEDLYTETVKSFGKIIRKHKLNYVQLPTFANIWSLKKLNEKKDGGSYVSEDVLHQYLVIKSNFLDQLTQKNPKVKFFQELPGLGEMLSLGSEGSNHYFGRPRENLYKVGYWDSKLSQEEADQGANLSSHLPNFQKQLWFVADLFVNYSSEENDKDLTRGVNHIHTMYNGVRWQSLGVLRPDVATSLALSYHNYLDKKSLQGDEYAMNQWQEALKVKMIDPNRQHHFLKYDKKN